MKVAILDDYQRVASDLAEWDELGHDVDVEFISEHFTDAHALAARLSGCEVVVAMRERTPFPASLLGLLPDLRLLVTTGPFNASIDIAAAAERDILVCGTGGILSTTAELTWALILAVLRHVPAEDRAVRDGVWQSTVGGDLRDRTLGIVGLGNIGTLVAAVGRAFGMNVIAWSENLTPQRCVEQGVGFVSRAELFRRSDVLSIHLKLSDRTRGIVGPDEFALMKSSAVLINTSRAELVDETALLDALRQHRIGGAGLDVFWQEPLASDHPILSVPNTVLTPHLGYVTADCYRTFFRDAIEDIVAWRDGSPVRVVEPPPVL